MNSLLDIGHVTSNPLLDTERLLRESAPVAVILLFWNVLSELFAPNISSGLFWAGIVMTLLYVVVRGVALAESTPAASRPDDLQAVLAENVRVALTAGVWFLAAELLYLARSALAFSTMDLLALACSGAGVGVVALYALAVGIPRVRDETRRADDGVTDESTGEGSTDATPADD